MKNRKYLLAALTCAAVFALSIAASGQVRRSVTKTDRFDFGAGGSVTLIGAPEGAVTIRSGTRNEIEITAVSTLTAPTDADAAKFSGSMGFVTQESLGRTTIISVGPGIKKDQKKIDSKTAKSLKGVKFSVDYTITVPRFCDLDLNIGTGALSIEGVEGSIKVNAISSDARLNLMGGSVAAIFGGGSVNAKMPDRSWRGGPIDIQVATGDLTVELPAALSAELDATILRTGEIEYSIGNVKPRDRNTPFTEKQMRARAGSGGVAMRFTVGDGKLRLVPLGK